MKPAFRDSGCGLLLLRRKVKLHKVQQVSSGNFLTMAARTGRIATAKRKDRYQLVVGSGGGLGSCRIFTDQPQ